MNDATPHGAMNESAPTPQEQAACAHLHVEYRKLMHDDGTNSDAWACRDCSREFVPLTTPKPQQPNEQKREAEHFGKFLEQLCDCRVMETPDGEIHQTSCAYVKGLELLNEHMEAALAQAEEEQVALRQELAKVKEAAREYFDAREKYVPWSSDETALRLVESRRELDALLK